ncbi:MAG TPA: response regulator transcription factor [Tepidisphaeraceae bacterium]
MRLLVVEDFQPLRDSLVQGFREAGYAVDEAPDGQAALWHARNGEHDVIVLDIMLPKLDGLSVLKQLREKNSPSLVLLLTAKDTPEDKINGLELGADDYLVKPFLFAELLARVRALVRRKYDTKSTILRIADLEVDTSRRNVRRGGKPIDLSGREYALLEYLAHNTDRIVSRTDIWQHVYDFNASPESNVVDVYIGLLRKKIEREGEPRLIHTRRGQGYLLAEKEQR